MSAQHSRTLRHHGFTLVELLVVVGIIATLVSILLPAMSGAKRRAITTQCKANLNQAYSFMRMYGNDNRDWIYPVGRVRDDKDGFADGLGTDLTPDRRWPVYVFTTYKPRVSNPPVLICPNDRELGAEDASAADKHSYLLNKHIVYAEVKWNRWPKDEASQSQIIIMGEKKSEYYDYYMEVEWNQKPPLSDYDKKVELARHGLNDGSNLLYLDGHVDSRPAVKRDPSFVDPWQISRNEKSRRATKPGGIRGIFGF